MIKRQLALFSLSRRHASLAGVVLLAGCAGAPIATQQPAGWTKDEVADSYVFGYPLVLMSTMRDDDAGTGPGQAPFNTFHHAQALPAVGSANPPTPGLDTLDSTGWLDLGAEPVIVSLPDSHGRYVDARALDMWTNVLWSTSAAAGARVSGIKAQTIAFVGPGWKGDLPDGVKRVDVPTRNAWLIVRIQSQGPRDTAAVRKLQRGIRMMPLSAYNGDSQPSSVTPGSGAADDSAHGAPAAQVAALDANGFFGELAQELQANPPAPADPHALKILADLGVTPGAPVTLPRGAAGAIAAGLTDGRNRVATPPSNLLSSNGWRWFGDGVGNYGADYAQRAYAAYTAPGIGTKDDEVRAIATRDSEGDPLSGANRYVIHFAPNQLPPVRGFWSITAYTKEGARGDSAAARVALSDRSGVRRNRDGSLDVTVSSAKVRAANWLPAPRADFQLVLRLYAAKPQATDGSWAPPAVVRQ